jgi:hypothetical protein
VRGFWKLFNKENLGFVNDSMKKLNTFKFTKRVYHRMVDINITSIVMSLLFLFEDAEPVQFLTSQVQPVSWHYIAVFCVS